MNGTTTLWQCASQAMLDSTHTFGDGCFELSHRGVIPLVEVLQQNALKILSEIQLSTADDARGSARDHAGVVEIRYAAQAPGVLTGIHAVQNVWDTYHLETFGSDKANCVGCII
ncbi:hypothetical protein E1B28_010835 [Marasmius oreades]|uniref:Uncharacterized protein n=1 Tax=Marasmius oreades TaxID=181124 RepID=A0A9P7RT17_9AGAR|nr:uncharacterized protein E1B28_010835 [Marasmius oreades]KAG7089127.1 hypothetical protein E1B28_010835 [Marasmius oreades]